MASNRMSSSRSEFFTMLLCERIYSLGERLFVALYLSYLD